MIEARSEADARKKTIAAPGQITPATLVTGAGTNLRDTRSPPPMPMTPVASATPPTASDGRCQPAARVPEQTRLIHTAPASASVGLQRGLETKIKAMTNPVAMVACPLGNVLSPSNFVDATSNTCDEDLAAQQPDHYNNHEHQHDSGAGDDIQDAPRCLARALRLDQSAQIGRVAEGLAEVGTHHDQISQAEQDQSKPA